MIQRPITLTFQHRIAFTHGAFSASNHTLRDLVAEEGDLQDGAKVLVLIDEGIAQADPQLVRSVNTYFEAHSDVVRLVGDPIVLKGGEPCKNDWSLIEKIWKAIDYYKVCRHSFIVAIGGGAFVDMAGFAAATAHRGIRLIRMPTTTLSQGDGGVGVKNGVNYHGKKNWVGTFTVPYAVVNDLDFLRHLPQRACRDGIIEAIKVSLIRDRPFFEYLESHGEALGQLETKPLEKAIRRSAELHVEHIATSGDPFERGSARPLDFGHWVAHKLEQLSDFAVTHGEAVAIGMAVDLIYSTKIGLLESKTAERILDLIEQVGFNLWSDFLDQVSPSGKPVVLEGLEEFREHLGGELTITLVPEIGRKIEVHEMNEQAILKSLHDLKTRHQSKSDAGIETSAAAK